MLSFFVTGLPLHHLNKTISTSVIDFLTAYEQSVSVQLVKHDLVWPQAGSGGIPAAVRLVWNTKNEMSNNDIFKWRFAMIYIKLYITDQNHGLVQFYFFLEHHIIENKASFKTVIWCLWEFVVSGFYSSISSWIVCVWLLFLSLAFVSGHFTFLLSSTLVLNIKNYSIKYFELDYVTTNETPDLQLCSLK
jgi:hypothetical protein